MEPLRESASVVSVVDVDERVEAPSLPGRFREAKFVSSRLPPLLLSSPPLLPPPPSTPLLPSLKEPSWEDGEKEEEEEEEDSRLTVV